MTKKFIEEIVKLKPSQIDILRREKIQHYLKEGRLSISLVRKFVFKKEFSIFCEEEIIDFVENYQEIVSLFNQSPGQYADLEALIAGAERINVAYLEDERIRQLISDKKLSFPNAIHSTKMGYDFITELSYEWNLYIMGSLGTFDAIFPFPIRS